jgi:hypothetical protein
MLDQLESAARHWSAEAGFWRFVLTGGVLLFGGLTSAWLIIDDSMTGMLTAPRFGMHLALGGVEGVFWGSAMWLCFRGVRSLSRRFRRE